MFMNWIQVQVTKRSVIAERIVYLELEKVDGLALPTFQPGAHIDMRIPNSNLVRQYSMVNDPVDTQRYVFAIQKELHSRGGSDYIYNECKVGQSVWISPPKNRFQLVDTAPHHILIAGGIGITPLLSMANYLHRQNQSFILHYSTRSRNRSAFYDELSECAFAKQVRFYHDDYQGHIAFNLRMALENIDLKSHVYVCGPATLIRAVLAGAKVVGLPIEQVHYEYFSTQGLATSAQTQPNKAFKLFLARSHKEVLVEADETIVQALKKEDIDVLVSCQEGICGTCVTQVLEGEVDHRDHYLHAEEKASHRLMTVCCSRAKGDYLVIDR